MSAPDDVVELIARALSDVGLPHALIGGHAVSAFLPPRFTADIDITVKADPAALDRLRVALERSGYRMTVGHSPQLPSGPDFVRFERGQDDPPIELQMAKTRFQEVVIERACVAESGLAIATAEDLIVLKLIAYRSKDRADLAGLVNLRAVDWHHVEMWAREWDVLDRLARVRDTE